MKRKVIEILPTVHKTVQDTKEMLRVAAYCRVSTDSNDQENSLENQMDEFKKSIDHHEGWELVKVYSDKGISGKSAQNRPGFLEMIQDCRDGKIDRIITKSISRFARNTRDTIDYVRMLRDYCIGVYFDKESLFTLDSHIDLILTIMSSLAEEESRSLSTNVKWTFQKKSAEGIVIWPRKIYGYDVHDKNQFVNPIEAKVVKTIFNMYELTLKPPLIAEYLMKKEIPSPRNCGKWHNSVIWGILRNEAYIGDLMLQKTYADDFLSKRKKNTGQAKKWYIYDDHEPIISRAQFKRVQELLNSTDNPMKRHNNCTKFLFSSLIYCSVCGRHYVHDYRVLKSGKVEVWVCTSVKHEKSVGCTAPRILDTSLRKAYTSISPSFTLDNIRDNITKIVMTDFSAEFFLKKGKSITIDLSSL